MAKPWEGPLDLQISRPALRPPVGVKALVWRGPNSMIRGNHTIRGVFAYSDDDFQQALDWIADGRAGIGDLKPLLPLEDGPDAFATLAKGPTDDIKVFLGA